MYRIKSNIDINSLTDGRTILYLSKKISYNREDLSNILRGRQSCSYKRAEQIVKACQPKGKVSDYFVKTESEG